MTTRDFLESILAPAGVIFVATPGDRGWYNAAHATVEGAVEHINQLTFEGKPAYFAPATFEKASYIDEQTGRRRSRTQANAQFMRSFFLDLDVGPGELKFESKADALKALKAFTKKLDLPKPTVVDSGGGIHVYWPLALAVPVSAWRPVADQLKAACVAEQFRCDMAVPADQARVLRAPGSYNVRRNAPVQVLHLSVPVSFTDFSGRMATYAGRHGAALVPVATQGRPPAGLLAGLDGNLGEAHNFDRIAFHCAQIGVQVGRRGNGTSEPLWRAALGVVKFCENQMLAGRAVSDQHPDFTVDAMLAKIGNWQAGPTRCDHFHGLNSSVCEGCPHWGKITSPAVLGRHVESAPAPQVEVAAPTPIGDEAAAEPQTVELPEPPVPYTRRKSDGAVVIETEIDDRPVQLVVCAYDLYPLAIRAQRQTELVDERSMWRAVLPLVKGAPPEPRDFEVPIGMLPDSKALGKLLCSKGVILDGEQIKLTQKYMTAYLQKLAREAGRDRLYERLGWHDEYQAFVLADRVLHADRTSTAHAGSDGIRNVTKNGLKPNGTLSGWKAAMRFYARPGYEGSRMFIYEAFASIIYHMNETGNKGVLFCASGASGRGKTTTFKAMSSAWGHPESLITNGNREGATTNALYSTLGTLHSLPFLLDDVTERDNEELRKFLLNYSQGEGKRRLLQDGSMSARFDQWANLGAITTNADTISAMMSTGKDLDPHMMRLISVHFSLPDTGVEAKLAADAFMRSLNEHHGHAGPIFAAYVVQNYEAVKRRYIANIAKIERMLASTNASAERFWSGAVAACYTAAEIICNELKLLDYPYEADLQWMTGLLVSQRVTIRETATTPLELLSQFLDDHLRNTLIMSVKSANLDNVVQKPFAELQIRRETDTSTIYVARTAIIAYCSENRAPFRTIEKALLDAGVLVQHNAQKTLGADTPYSNGQIRCWKIDAGKLDALQQQGTTAVSKTVPVTGTTTMH
jgi:hypothetical protein